MKPAALVLENGATFRGVGFGAAVESIGEVVFNTSITGYQEIATDPSYCGQMVVMTASHIGNVGQNRQDDEASPACRGLIVREVSPSVSNWRAEGNLSDLLAAHGIPGLAEIDTRRLTRILRDEGAMRGAITPDGDFEAVLARVRRAPVMTGLDLVPQVTCAAPYAFTESRWAAPDHAPVLPPVAPRPLRVVAYDFGVKRSILQQLVGAGFVVEVVPGTTPASEVLRRQPHGVFLSNGPGDPAAVTYAIDAVRELMAAKLPIMGICLGHQILALALGGKTYKLPFGHHGGNHPVLDIASGRVQITAQNHGFAVDAATLPPGCVVSHKSLYDGTVEGLVAKDRLAFSVQHHPEASPGPHDADALFASFHSLLLERQ